MYKNLGELNTALEKVATLSGDDIIITNAEELKGKTIDDLVFTAVFTSDENLKKEARSTIRRLAKALGIEFSSIHDYYMAIGRGEILPNSTVPAINVRALTYDTAGIIFKLMIRHQVGPVVFEIARSEIEYTDQRPDEYAVSILASAIKNGYKGPVFVQGDHFQFSQKRYVEDKEAETNKIKALIEESLAAGFYNIDIDASTLVDLSKQSLDEQQEENYTATLGLVSYIRSLSKGDKVSIGAEIGHIGGKNSTPEDLEAFMTGFNKNSKEQNGISKISVQTGTSHGGIPLPDGTIAKVKLDFNVIEEIGKVAREKYRIGGVVQHGASTLPNDLFDQFPKHKTLEIHLATGLQNIVFDNLPENLRTEINTWLENNHQPEWDDSLNRDQNIYKTRKRANGPFKSEFWHLSVSEKQPIIETLEKQLQFLFEKLSVFGTRSTLLQYV